jgi:hypothetical protein
VKGIQDSVDRRVNFRQMMEIAVIRETFWPLAVVAEGMWIVMCQIGEFLYALREARAEIAKISPFSATNPEYRVQGLLL